MRFSQCIGSILTLTILSLFWAYVACADTYILMSKRSVVSGFKPEVNLLLNAEIVDLIDVQIACFNIGNDNDIVVYRVDDRTCTEYGSIFTSNFTSDPLAPHFLTQVGQPASYYDLYSGKYTQLYYIDGLYPAQPLSPSSPPRPPPCILADAILVNPEFTAKVSVDTDRVIFFDDTLSSCYARINCKNQARACSYEWDFGGVGSVVGGNGTNIIVYQYDQGGDYLTTLTMTELISGVMTSADLMLTAEIVETPPPVLDIASIVSGTTVTLSIIDPDLSDAAVESVIVFWGDRYRDEYIGVLPVEIGHAYSRTGTYYHIRVNIINVDGDEFNYTFMADEDLTVSIP